MAAAAAAIVLILGKTIQDIENKFVDFAAACQEPDLLSASRYG